MITNIRTQRKDAWCAISTSSQRYVFEFREANGQEVKVLVSRDQLKVIAEAANITLKDESTILC